MSIFDQITNIDIENIDISNYSEHETLEDLDKIITIKWEAAEKAVQNI